MKATTLPPEVGAKLGDVQAIAAKLGCSPRHVYRMADAGRMPAPVKPGSLVRWNLAEIDAWIASGCPACRIGRGR